MYMPYVVNSGSLLGFYILGNLMIPGQIPKVQSGWSVRVSPGSLLGFYIPANLMIPGQILKVQ
jgi:hypothetical protein